MKSLINTNLLTNRLYPRPEVGASSPLAKVHFLKSGPRSCILSEMPTIDKWHPAQHPINSSKIFCRKRS